MLNFDTPSLLEQGRRMHSTGRLSDAEQLYRQVLKQDPNNVDALNLLATLAIQINQPQAGEQLALRACQVAPQSPVPCVTVGNARLAMKNINGAIEAFVRALQINPNLPDAFYQLGLAYAQAGRNAEAAGALERACQLAPNMHEAFNNLGVLLTQMGRVGEAVMVFRRAAQLRPDIIDAWSNLGYVARTAGLVDEAIEASRRAVGIDPNSSSAHLHLGIALQAAGKFTEGLASIERVLELNPENVEGLNSLGNGLRYLGKSKEAVDAYRRAIAINPDYGQCRSNLSSGLAEIGCYDEAIVECRLATQQVPNDAEIRSNLATLLMAIGDIIGATAIYREAVAISPAAPRVRSNLLMCSLHNWEMPPEVMSREHRDWHTYCGAPCAPLIKPLSNNRDPDRKLRVGYMSPDMRLHPVAYFFVPLIENHDPSQFEIHCIADVPKPDYVSERIRKHAFAWHEISGKSDDQAADIIRSLGIDILVDLAGHTSGNRVPVFTRCPAPVQVCYLGYSFTLGTPTIPYRFTDAICDPPGVTDHLHVEKLIRLPEVVGCFDPLVVEDLPVQPTPALKNGHVTIACFHRGAKLSEPAANLWGRFFAEVPTAKLMLVGNGYRFPTEIERVKRWFKGHGIDASRIEFRPSVPYDEYLKIYNDVDLVLDSFPFNGHTTNLQGMWMGVPFVTLIGQTYQARMGASVLTNLGLPELIAHSPEEYVNIAEGLANDIPRLAALRAGMRERLRQSPIMQPKRLAQAIEGNYRAMWRAWCRGEQL